MNLQPLDMILSVRSRLGEPPLSMEDTAEFNEYTEEEIVCAIDSFLRMMFVKYLECHANDWTKSWTHGPPLTFISGSTTEIQVPAATVPLLLTVVELSDSSGNTIPEIPYEKYTDYYNKGIQGYWLREDPTYGTVIGFTFPTLLTWFKLRYVQRPRAVIGGRGVTQNSTNVQVSIPYWGYDATSPMAYYDASNKLVTTQVTDGKPGTINRLTIGTHGSGVLVAGPSSVYGTNVLWCTTPDWAPDCIKDFLVKRVALDLYEGRTGRAPVQWHREVLLAEQEFKNSYVGRTARSVTPYSLMDTLE